jgi:hypothetical protein
LGDTFRDDREGRNMRNSVFAVGLLMVVSLGCEQPVLVTFNTPLSITPPPFTPFRYVPAGTALSSKFALNVPA